MSCWVWDGYCTPGGYGYTRVEGRPQYVHRASYEALVGPIPDGLEIDHLCRNKACYNPAHLEPVTQQVNLRRAADAITHCPNDHPYDEANTRWYRGRRQCKACRSAAQKAYRELRGDR